MSTITCVLKREITQNVMYIERDRDYNQKILTYIAKTAGKSVMYIERYRERSTITCVLHRDLVRVITWSLLYTERQTITGKFQRI